MPAFVHAVIFVGTYPVTGTGQELTIQQGLDSQRPCPRGVSNKVERGSY